MWLMHLFYIIMQFNKIHVVNMLTFIQQNNFLWIHLLDFINGVAGLQGSRVATLSKKDPNTSVFF